MDVVGHHHPVVEQITPAVKMSECGSDHVRNFGSTEMAFAHPLVEVTLNLAAKFAMDFLDPVAGGSGRKPVQRLGLFVLKAQQNFFRQGIGEPEGDEVSCPFAFDVRQITARVDAGAKRVGGFARNAPGTQLEFYSLQSAIGFIGVHAGWGIKLVFGWQFCIRTVCRLAVGDTADYQSALHAAWVT